MGSWLEMRTGKRQLDTGLRALSLDELTKGVLGQLETELWPRHRALGHSDVAEQKGSWLWSLRRVGRDTPPSATRARNTCVKNPHQVSGGVMGYWVLPMVNGDEAQEGLLLWMGKV